MSEINNLKVIWFSNPKKFRYVNFEEYNIDPQESTYFENNGKGKYFYAYNKETKRYQKAGKVINNFFIIPFLALFYESTIFSSIISLNKINMSSNLLIIIICISIIIILYVYFKKVK